MNLAIESFITFTLKVDSSDRRAESPICSPKARSDSTVRTLAANALWIALRCQETGFAVTNVVLRPGVEVMTIGRPDDIPSSATVPLETCTFGLVAIATTLAREKLRWMSAPLEGELVGSASRRTPSGFVDTCPLNHDYRRVIVA